MNEQPHVRRFAVGAAARRLRGMATGGTASIAVGVAATNALRIVSSITLTRLLSADAFGVVGIIMSAAITLAMLLDIGIFPFIVRHREADDPNFQDQVWTLRLLRSAALAVALAALATPIAMFVGREELTLVLMVWSVSFIIEGLSSLAFATAVRQGMLWKLSSLEFAASVAQIIVAVAVALLTPTYWAIVVGMLAGAVVKTILSYALFAGSRRTFVLHRDRAREMWRFSRYIAPSSLLSLLILQADKLVLARLLPLTTFGFYSVATTLVAAPAAVSYPYVTRVLLPAYAAALRVSSGRLGAVFYRQRRTVALLYMFAIGGLIGGAPLVVEILYDPRYRPVAQMMQILSLSTMLLLNNGAAEQALIAMGRTRATLSANIARVAWLAAGGITGLAVFGAWGLVWVVGLIEWAAMLSLWSNLRREGLLSIRQELLGFVAAALGALIGWGGAAVGLRLILGA